MDFERYKDYTADMYGKIKDAAGYAEKTLRDNNRYVIERNVNCSTRIVDKKRNRELFGISREGSREYGLFATVLFAVLGICSLVLLVSSALEGAKFKRCYKEQRRELKKLRRLAKKNQLTED